MLCTLGRAEKKGKGKKRYHQFVRGGKVQRRVSITKRRKGGMEDKIFILHAL